MCARPPFACRQSMPRIVVRHHQHQGRAGRGRAAERPHDIAAGPGRRGRGVDLVVPGPAFGLQLAADGAGQPVERVVGAIGIFAAGSEEARDTGAVQRPGPAAGFQRRIGRFPRIGFVDGRPDALDDQAGAGRGSLRRVRLSGSGRWVAARRQQRQRQARTDHRPRPASCTRWCRACRGHGRPVHIAAAGGPPVC